MSGRGRECGIPPPLFFSTEKSQKAITVNSKKSPFESEQGYQKRGEGGKDRCRGFFPSLPPLPPSDDSWHDRGKERQIGREEGGEGRRLNWRR